MVLKRSETVIHKSERDLRNQVADFFDKCDKDTYTYGQVHSTKQLMRVLQSPQISDILGRLGRISDKVLVSRTIHGGEPEIHWNNVAHVKEEIQKELDRQIRCVTGAKHTINFVDIEKIWQEYKKFVGQSAKEKAELIALFANNTNLPYPIPQSH